MRRLALATTVLAAALAAPAYAGATPASGPTHCDERRVNVLCLDQGDDGTIYQCLVWVASIEPEDNPTCFAIW